MRISGKLICIVGKSGSGKDTLFRHIKRFKPFDLTPIIPYTTRPRRQGERSGKDYHFFTEEMMLMLQRNGEIIESRRYDTIAGAWYYFTKAFDLNSNETYITITTPEALTKLAAYVGEKSTFVVYLTLSDRERLMRAVRRESKQKTPNFAEVCRRYLADERDFSDFETTSDRYGGFLTIDANGSAGDCYIAFHDGVKNLIYGS
jgi:guanylate kinase